MNSGCACRVVAGASREPGCDRGCRAGRGQYKGARAVPSHGCRVAAARSLTRGAARRRRASTWRRTSCPRSTGENTDCSMVPLRLMRCLCQSPDVPRRYICPQCHRQVRGYARLGRVDRPDAGTRWRRGRVVVVAAGFCVSAWSAAQLACIHMLACVPCGVNIVTHPPPHDRCSVPRVYPPPADGAPACARACRRRA